MTFEASRKKQTLVLQPRGKPLYEEKSSFGLKMLEAMGWQKGNGLGKNQQGNKNFIQVRYKNNDFGLGFDGLKDNQWTQNESNFDSLLKELNSSQAENSASNSDQDDSLKSKSTKSLEEQSKQSRARIHYKKFTRGKDVFKYSEKDLANIFGKKSLKYEDQPIEEIVKPKKEIEDKPETYKSDLIINTGVSINDYFNQKKKNLVAKEEIDEPPKKKSKRNKIDQLINEEDSCKEKEDFIITPDVQSTEIDKKKKKKKHEIIEEVKPVIDEEISNRKKKKSKQFNKEEKSIVEDQLQLVKEKTINKKRKNDMQQIEEEVINESQALSQRKLKKFEEDERPKGTNAFYSSDVIQIPSHIANKISHVNISVFNNSNIGDIVGYGMSADVELKVVKTKMGEKFDNADKYALYNMDKLQTKQVNPRKIKTKLKKTKKTIQVI
ncbi:hypothetical protein PVAND_014311 [Polypedilum vanderplanki]|uniref:G-patch domain-containing protein n=1 Tax=Polypedilum vanderplanki TaxID=319348 RepID=A0A9J6CRY5_POLVA|nr:hypothetical protein PVAND_014311 [Polypedilum vanderplanki]